MMQPLVVIFGSLCLIYAVHILIKMEKDKKTASTNKYCGKKICHDVHIWHDEKRKPHLCSGI